MYTFRFFDGRFPPDSAKGYIEELEAKLKENGVGKNSVCDGTLLRHGQG
jgi:2,3-bisphosphoglycerate-independent phosphoglycerate mutase